MEQESDSEEGVVEWVTANIPLELKEWLREEPQKCMTCRRRYFGEGAVSKIFRTRVAGEPVVVKGGFCRLSCAGPLWKHQIQTKATKNARVEINE